MIRRFYFRALLVFSFALLILLTSIGSASVHATGTPVLLGVVRGTDNGVYYSTCFGTCQTPATTSWGAWASLSGSTDSAPTLCVNSAANTGTADLIVRGTDNGIYHKAYSSGSWSSIWDSPGGGTNDQPACVAYGGQLYVVVRGTDNALYFNQYSPMLIHPWGASWTPLGGATNSAPTLIYDDYSSNPRLDLFVRGTDNAVYHKAGTINGGGGVSWASSWDNLGGATPSAPAGAWGGPGALVNTIFVFVRGTDNNIYENEVGLPTSGSGGTICCWRAGGGSTSMAPGMALNPGACGEYAALFVVGTDNALYGTAVAVTDWVQASPPYYQIYASAGGTVTSPPALTWISVNEGALVEGAGGVIYYNVFAPDGGPSSTTWQRYVSLGGTTPSTPAIANIATSC